MTVETTPESYIGPTPDRDETIRVMSLYIDGSGAHRPEMFSEAMHPASRMYFTWPDGGLWEGPLLGIALNREDPWANKSAPAVGRIIALMGSRSRNLVR